MLKQKQIFTLLLLSSLGAFADVGEVKADKKEEANLLPELSAIKDSFQSVGKYIDNTAMSKGQVALLESTRAPKVEEAKPTTPTFEESKPIDFSKTSSPVGESLPSVMTDSVNVQPEPDKPGNTESLMKDTRALLDEGRTGIPLAKVNSASSNPNFRQAREGQYNPSKYDTDSKMVIKGLSDPGTSFGVIRGSGDIFESASQSASNSKPSSFGPTPERDWNKKSDDEKKQEEEKEKKAEQEYQSGLEEWAGKADDVDALGEGDYFQIRDFFSEHNGRINKLTEDNTPSGFNSVVDSLYNRYGKFDNSEDKYSLQNYISRRSEPQIVFRPEDSIIHSERNNPNHRDPGPKKAK